MKPRVLIVDDSLTVRKDLEEAFSAAGFEPVVSADLRSASAALANGPYVLVVLDVLLPDGDGIDLLRRLKQNPDAASIRVLVLSTEAEVKDRVRGLSIGADDFVGKPYDRGYIVHRALDLVRERPRETLHDGRPVVLVIDDSLSVREELRAALEPRGYHVEATHTGEDGLRLAGHLRPAAVVVDGQLPGIDGATVVRRLRSDAALRTTPCLLLTASEESSAEVRSLDAGADTFVRKGDGTDVIVARLEAILRSVGAQPSQQGGAGGSLFGPKRILAVDDSVTYLRALIDALKRDAYEVIPASSGDEALELLRVQPVDCILLDLVMPGLSGDETCRRIKQDPQWREIPIVMLTARDDREAMLGGFRAGADDFVCKSSEFELLAARLRAQLRRKQYEDENRRIREQMLRKAADAAEARILRRLADTRARLLQDLERANAELESFSYSISHDLRAPLRAINGFVSIVINDFASQLPAEARDHLQVVLKNTRQMGQMIEDLLRFSRLGRQALQMETVDLGALVRDVVDELRPDAAVRDVRIAIGDLGVCQGDPRLLKHVFTNLVANAIKFTSKRAVGTIEIGRMSAENGEADVCFVKDNGAGFDSRFAEKLFGVFQRLHRSEEFEGTGVGLAIVDRIIRQHGGRIWAESALDRGATFYFSLEGVAKTQGEETQADDTQAADAECAVAAPAG